MQLRKNPILTFRSTMTSIFGSRASTGLARKVNSCPGVGAHHSPCVVLDLLCLCAVQSTTSWPFSQKEGSGVHENSREVFLVPDFGENQQNGRHVLFLKTQINT
mmetsp:Transcript_19099/g.29862  ORF Transcript_19099/g.29862 Transcript_19099/m.29862 type:complete len:104 (-) Transcript_19099:2502-2813(-)